MDWNLGSLDPVSRALDLAGQANEAIGLSVTSEIGFSEKGIYGGLNL